MTSPSPSRPGKQPVRQDRAVPPDLKQAVAPYERLIALDYLAQRRRQRSAHDGCGSGPLPYGYVRLADGTVGIDAAAAPIVRQVLHLRPQFTYQAAAERLNAAGYRTPKGRTWTPAHVYKIDRHRRLYETGVREWDGVVAQVRWPTLSVQEPRSA